MKLTSGTKIADLLRQYPFLVDFLPTLNARFSLLKNPLMRSTVGTVATLSQVAAIGGVTLQDLLEALAREILRQSGEQIELEGGTGEPSAFIDPQARHEMLKQIIRDLHDQGNFEDAKERFARLIKDIDATEIAAMEQKLIAEGMPQTEVKRLCDVHVQVFKDSLQAKDPPRLPEGHPVTTFMAENRAGERLMEKIETVMRQVGTPPDAARFGQFQTSLGRLLLSLDKIDLHFLRKENQLFPVLEKHGITGPSQVMWSLDDDIRGMLKTCRTHLEAGAAAPFVAAVQTALQTIRDMIYKEEHILFPMAAETLTEQEWHAVAAGESEIGFAWIEPAGALQPAATAPSAPISDGAVALDTGSLSPAQINLMLKTLPVDISFVNEHDEVRYYSATRERIFPRSPGVIGRKVQNCHPPRSMARVQEILDAFREGASDHARFWIQSGGRFILIQYFAMRDDDGTYRGCLEVSQDITDIRLLEGEQRIAG